LDATTGVSLGAGPQALMEIVKARQHGRRKKMVSFMVGISGRIHWELQSRKSAEIICLC